MMTFQYSNVSKYCWYGFKNDPERVKYLSAKENLLVYCLSNWLTLSDWLTEISDF